MEFSKIHFSYSCFVRNKETGLFAYLAINDVRSPNKFGSGFDSILVRQAEHVKDYSSGYRAIGSFMTLVEDLRRMTS